MIRENKMVVCVTLTAPLLGGLPFDDIAQTHVNTKTEKANQKNLDKLEPRLAEELAVAAAQAEQRRLQLLAAGADAEEARGTTGFARDDMGLFVWDYWFRGFIKEALETVIECGLAPDGFNNHNRKKKVDQLIFVRPRRIYLRKPSSERTTSSSTIWNEAQGFNTRPIRTEDQRTGAQRTAIARSEELPEGTWFVAEVVYLGPEEARTSKSGKKHPIVTKELLADILSYGSYKGLGQWRSGGWGTFNWQEMPDSKLVIPASRGTMTAPIADLGEQKFPASAVAATA